MSTAITPKAKTDDFMALVVARKSSFARLLPKGTDPEWFEGEIRVAVSRTPKLLDCDKGSLFDAITTCAQLGLSPSGRLGSAYLIPYGKQCQLVVGYRGYLDLAYRSGDVVGFRAEVVNQNDDFEAVEGFDLEVRHRRTEGEPGPLRAVYACAEMRGGYKVRVLMWAREVLAIKARSRASSGPWQTDEAEMWKKTALRRIIKLLPLSPQRAQGLSRAVEIEDAEYEDFAVEVEPEPTKGVEGLKSALKKKTEEQKTLPAASPSFADLDRQLEAARNKAPVSIHDPNAEPPEDVVLPGQRQPGEDG
jgi:recombination protein RecT